MLTDGRERRAMRIVVFVGLLFASVASAQEIAPDWVRESRYPEVSVAFPDGVKGKPGIVYWQPFGYRPLTLDLYLPPGPKPPQGFPLVIYIHGGAWTGGDSRRSGTFVDFPGVLASLAAKGYVVASLEYRFSGEAKFPAPILDVKAAIRWLRRHAPEYGIDPGRLLAWGVSAGGHLASLAAVTCGVEDLEPVDVTATFARDAPIVRTDGPPVSDCVQAAVIWFGIFDITKIADQARTIGALSRENSDSLEWRMLGCFKCETESMAASPALYVDAKTPPMLLIVGDADKVVPPQQTLDMADKLKAAGVPHDLIVLPNVDHDFIGTTPEATRENTLKALNATFAFIDKTMRR